MPDLALVEPVGSNRPSESVTVDQRLTNQLDLDLLDEIGWDPATLILRLPPGHPVVGWTKCRHPACSVIASRYPTREGLCDGCAKRRESLYMPTVEEYVTTIDLARFPTWARGEYLDDCKVDGCRRPVRDRTAGLCVAHLTHIKFHITARPTAADIDAFVNSDQARPYPGWGTCQAAVCLSLAGAPSGLCFVHNDRWRKHLRLNPDAEIDEWCATASGIAASGVINLRGLHRLVRLQILVALQRRVRSGVKNHVHWLDRLADFLRAGRHTDLMNVHRTRNESMDCVLRVLQNEIRLALADPMTEQQKDLWNMQVFGIRGNLDFTVITQRWLRQITKVWVLDELPTRRGADINAPMQDHLHSIVALSKSLRLTRDDDGDDPARLTRGDIVALLNRLAHEQRQGDLSLLRRSRVIRNVRTVLRHARDTGLARPGRPIEHLPAEFSIRAEDIPSMPIHTAEGRSLPNELFGQLAAALPELERRKGAAVRVAIELLIETGRRPDEICRLPIDCLDAGSAGKAVLVYTDFKQNRLDRRLPITDATADIIREQQTRVRKQYPNTPPARLVLLPAQQRNPHGDRSIRATTLTNFHHDWIQAQPPFTFLDGTLFPKQRIILYAYRHSYAQRHADAGTPVDVLRDLMGHRNFASTQTYYRITEKRTRAAVDTLAAHQLDGAGRRLWHSVDGLLDSDRARQRVGEVVVPFGSCTEPSNVRAGGGACPFRFRCTGCGHFRTDVSYLPELRGYLDQLLANRERVTAATELEEWARVEATPSDTEIDRVRVLIRRVEQDLDNLEPAERTEILNAVNVVRVTRRTVHLGVPQIGTPSDHR